MQVGFLNRDGLEITAGQLIAAAPEPHTVRLLSREFARVDRVIFRNGPSTEPAEALVHGATLYRRKEA